MPVRIGAIVVGGKGSRFGESYVQKCLVPVGGKPILEYTIDAFVASGVKLIFFLTGFLHEQVSAYLTQRFSHAANFVPASVFGGTTGIAPALCTLRHFINEGFLFSHGDSIIRTNEIDTLVGVAAEHQESLALMLVSREINVLSVSIFLSSTQRGFRNSAIRQLAEQNSGMTAYLNFSISCKSGPRIAVRGDMQGMSISLFCQR